MQSLRSRNRASKNLQGCQFSPAGVRKLRITKNLRKLTSAVDFGPSKSQNRFAHAKLGLHVGVEVIRRDGLSSRRVILFVAAGMLTGKAGTQNWNIFERKVEVSHAKPNSLRSVVFF